MDTTNMERLVQSVTETVMKRLVQPPTESQRKRFLVLGKDPDCPVRACLGRDFEADIRPNLDDAKQFDYAVLPVWYLDKLRGAAPAAEPSAPTACIDLRRQHLLHERELRERCGSGVKAVRVGKTTIITSLAADFLKSRGLTVLREDDGNFKSDSERKMNHFLEMQVGGCEKERQTDTDSFPQQQ